MQTIRRRLTTARFMESNDVGSVTERHRLQSDRSRSRHTLRKSYCIAARLQSPVAARFRAPEGAQVLESSRLSAERGARDLPPRRGKFLRHRKVLCGRSEPTASTSDAPAKGRRYVKRAGRPRLRARPRVKLRPFRRRRSPAPVGRVTPDMRHPVSSSAHTTPSEQPKESRTKMSS